MPKLELKAVQRELEQGVLWPFYWVYGPEKLKSRELLKRIRTAVLGSDAEGASGWGWGEEILEGTEVDSAHVVDAARSLSLGQSVRLVIVRDAHALKNPEQLSELFGPAQKLSELTSVCVCLSKDLDARKKFSKTLIDKAAVIPCEEVVEAQRESWIQYLAKRRNMDLNAAIVTKLYALDPWSLDIVEQELEKYSIAGLTSEVILEDPAAFGGADHFLEKFFRRDLQAALPEVSRFAESPEDSLPLLGLLGWNVRQLAILLSDQVNGTRYSKLNPYVVERFRKWSGKWTLREVLELQKDLSEIDWSMKQTPLLPLGLWGRLVGKYCCL